MAYTVSLRYYLYTYVYKLLIYTPMISLLIFFHFTVVVVVVLLRKSFITHNLDKLCTNMVNKLQTILMVILFTFFLIFFLILIFISLKLSTANFYNRTVRIIYETNNLCAVRNDTCRHLKILKMFKKTGNSGLNQRENQKAYK